MSYYVHVAAESLVAGLVAFGVTYQASNDLRTSIIAGMLAGITKAFPSTTILGPKP